jgi:hypothetical protein
MIIKSNEIKKITKTSSERERECDERLGKLG